MSEAASAASVCLSKHAQFRVNVQRRPNFETGLLPHFMLFYCIKIYGVANQPDCGKERFTGALCFNMFQLVSGPALRIANEIFALFSSGPTHLDKLAGAQIKNKIQKKFWARFSCRARHVRSTRTRHPPIHTKTEAKCVNCIQHIRMNILQNNRLLPQALARANHNSACKSALGNWPIWNGPALKQQCDQTKVNPDSHVLNNKQEDPPNCQRNTQDQRQYNTSNALGSLLFSGCVGFGMQNAFCKITSATLAFWPCDKGCFASQGAKDQKYNGKARLKPYVPRAMDATFVPGSHREPRSDHAGICGI